MPARTKHWDVERIKTEEEIKYNQEFAILDMIAWEIFAGRAIWIKKVLMKKN